MILEPTPISQRGVLGAYPLTQVLDLEGYIISEEDDGGAYAYFSFHSGDMEPFARLGVLPPKMREQILQTVVTKKDIWSYDPCRVGCRILGEAPDRTIPNWKRPIFVLRPRVKDWAIFVVSGVSELFIREGALDFDLQTNIRTLLTNLPS